MTLINGIVWKRPNQIAVMQCFLCRRSDAKHIISPFPSGLRLSLPHTVCQTIRLYRKAERERERFERSGRVSSSDLNVTGLIFCPWCHQELLLMYHKCNRVWVLERVCLKIQAKRYFCSDTVWAGSYNVKIWSFYISFECMCKRYS